MAADDEFAPFLFGRGEDRKTYSLAFGDFDPTAEVFEDMGREGGGYGWRGAVDALVRMRAPKLKKKLRYDPEASPFVVLSEDREALRRVAALMREALADPEVLREAIENADPDLMD
jgi:hypothetical protein